MANLELLSPIRSNPKLAKGIAYGYASYVLHLAPANASGAELCQWRSRGCTASCLYTAGHAGVFANINEARIRKARWFTRDRDGFMTALVNDIERAIRQAARLGLTPAFRLNGTSDIPWERIPVGDHANIMAAFPRVQFYDYTKAPYQARVNRPLNYHLTMSRSENNHARAIDALEHGMSVAVVFAHPPYPERWHGYPVVDGDLSDLRFLDPPGSVVALKAKGRARFDATGFVVHAEMPMD